MFIRVSYKVIGALLLGTFAARANVCTPLSRPAFGPFPAIVNGIDAVDWSLARITWTSDATSSVPATAQRIRFATAAQWAANAGVYPQTFGLIPITASNNMQLQGAILTNLQPSTTYHVVGESYQGGAWCTAPDKTFATLAYPGTVHPTPPVSVNTTRPVITRHDYRVGGDCSSLQACLYAAVPGDGIGLPPGLYQTAGSFNVPRNPNAIWVPSITLSSSLFNSNAHGLTNGTQIRVGADYGVPNPVNPGATYTVVNATANAFQVSLDGVNPVALNDTGSGNIYVIRWPLTQPYIVIHSTSTNLPPEGVRLDPVAYGAQLPNIQKTANGGGLFSFGALASYYWFQDVELSTAPIATAGQIDPQPYSYLMITGAQNDHIILDQVWMHAAPPPDRVFVMAQWDGSNLGIINSYMDNSDYWQPTRLIGSVTTTATALTIPTGSYNYVGSGGVKQGCTNATAKTLTFAGGTGSFYVYYDTGCTLHADLQTGVTASGSAFTISTLSSPSFPVDYTGRNGVLKIGQGTLGSGSITSYFDSTSTSQDNLESSLGIHMSAGPGPYVFSNNYFDGSGIVGPYASDDLSSSTPCNGSPTGPCQQAYQQSDLTVTRNTITTKPSHVVGSPTWNGGFYSWRNGPELKQMHRWKFDGNIIGPLYVGIANGGCILNFAYTAGLGLGTVSYVDSGDGEISNNTCVAAGGGFLEAVNPNASGQPYPIKRLWIHNNLFLNNNGWTQNNYTQSYSDFRTGGDGRQAQWGSGGQDYIWEHNTALGQGGQTPLSFFFVSGLPGGLQVKDSILNYVNDNGFGGILFGSNLAQGGGASVPEYSGYSGSALLNVISNSVWKGNVMLATWAASNPLSLVELTNSQIDNVKSLYPAAPGTIWPEAGTALGDRISQVGWLNPALNNLRLKSSSAFISGGMNHATDGLDVGADIDALEAAQGKVSNIRTYGSSGTTTKIGFLAPDAFGCTVDWGTSNFTSGSGSYTRVANAGGQRSQNVTLLGLPARALIYYRVNCAAQQPTGTVQLP